jgi:hypothetical protein
MAKAKTVTIKLTEKQRKQVHKLTGEEPAEMWLEAPPKIGKVKPASTLTAGRPISVQSESQPGAPALLTFRIDR